MDKNTFTGLFLIMIIMGASVYFMRPSQDEMKKKALQEHADSIKAGKLPQSAAAKTAKFDTSKNKANQPLDSATLKMPFGAATVGTDKLVTLENKDIRVKLTTHGGRVFSVEL